MTAVERVALLLDSGQIDTAVAAAMPALSANIAAALGRGLDGEAGGMLVTHLALALARGRRGEPVQDLDPALLEAEAATHPRERRLAGQVLDAAARRLGPLDLPAAEAAMLALHLARVAAEAPPA